VRDEVRRRLSC